MPKRNRTLIYARLSRTAKDGEVNLADQIKLCLEQTHHAHETCDPRTDIYQEAEGLRSGYSIKHRDDMRRMIERIQTDPSVGQVRCYDLERVWRNTREGLAFLELLQARGVRLITVKDSEIKYDTSSDKLIATFRFAGAQMYRDYVSDQLKAAYARARKNNWVWHRRAPLGLKLIGSKETRKFVPDPKTLPAIIELFTLLANGITPHRAALELRKRNVKARTYDGSAVIFDEYHVRSLLRHIEFYRGHVPDQLMDTAIRRVASRRNKRGPAHPRKHPPLILHHFLTCAICGRPYYAEHTKSRTTSKLFPYYRHATFLCPKAAHKITAQKLDEQIFDILDRFARNLTQQSGIVERIAAAQIRRQPATDNLSKRRAALIAKLSKAKAKLLDDYELVEEYTEIKSQIEAEVARLDEQLRSRVTVAVYTPAQIKRMLQDRARWRILAERKPDQFRIMLIDLFESVTLGADRRLRFTPHPALKPYFRGAL